jgi:hypothetical protein
MAEARSRAAWAHTSSVLAMLANVNRDPKRTRAFRPEDFDPHAQKDMSVTVVKGRNFDILKIVFVDARSGGKGVVEP